MRDHASQRRPVRLAADWSTHKQSVLSQKSHRISWDRVNNRIINHQVLHAEHEKIVAGRVPGIKYP